MPVWRTTDGWPRCSLLPTRSNRPEPLRQHPAVASWRPRRSSPWWHSALWSRRRWSPAPRVSHVLARLQPPHVAHRALAYREGVVPDGRVAEADFGASLNRSSMNAALPSWESGVSWNAAVIRIVSSVLTVGSRHRTSHRLLVAGVVGEGDGHLDGLAHVRQPRCIELVAPLISASSASHW